MHSSHNFIIPRENYAEKSVFYNLATFVILCALWTVILYY